MVVLDILIVRQVLDIIGMIIGGNPKSAFSLGELLQKCGFHTESRRISTVRGSLCPLYQFANTCYRLAGSVRGRQIDLRPFASDIAKVVSSLAYKMPNYYGRGLRPMTAAIRKT